MATSKTAVQADFTVSGGGSVFLVTPEHTEAREFLQSRVGGAAQWFGRALAVEHRYISGIVAQLQADGWSVA